MKKLFIIGGMGAGKSTARKALVDQGLEYIDLDLVGHEILKWDTVKDELREEFGDEIFDENGEVVRPKLAKLAFMTPANTRKLNRITMPRIEEVFSDRVADLEKAGCKALVVECSVYRNRRSSMAWQADVVIAIIAPVEIRVARAVAAGWDEADVRARIARQISDGERLYEADVTFSNDGTPEQLRKKIVDWWNAYRETI